MRILDRVPLALRVTQAFVALALAVCLAVLAWQHLLTLMEAGGMIAASIAYASWAVGRIWGRRRLRDVEVDERGLLLRGRLRWRRAAITSVEWTPISAADDAAHVRLIGRFRMMTLACTTNDDARALVEALKFAPEHRSVTFSFLPAVSKIQSWAAAALGIAAFGGVCAVMRAVSATIPHGVSFSHNLLVAFTPLAYLMPPSLAMGLLVGLLLRWATIKVDVGLDGIRIRRRQSDRFVAFAGVEWKRRIGTKMLSFKERGEREERWLSFVGFDAFLRRVEEAERLTSAAAPSTVVAPALSAGYRQSAYPKDVLLRVVEDRAQDVATRTTAADALQSGLDLAERERVRAVAATTASSDLRQRLEELAESEDLPLDASPAHRLRAIRAERDA